MKLTNTGTKAPTTTFGDLLSGTFFTTLLDNGVFVKCVRVAKMSGPDYAEPFAVGLNRSIGGIISNAREFRADSIVQVIEVEELRYREV